MPKDLVQHHFDQIQYHCNYGNMDQAKYHLSKLSELHEKSGGDPIIRETVADARKLVKDTNQ